MTQMMTQMMPKPDVMEFPEPIVHSVERLAYFSPGQMEHRNQIRAAAAFAFRDLVRIEVYQTSTSGLPGIHDDWKYDRTMKGIVVGVHSSYAPEEYAGLVPVLADDRYPTAGPYVSLGPRLLDPLTPQIERLPQGTGWLMYDLQHDRPAIIH